VVLENLYFAPEEVYKILSKHGYKIFRVVYNKVEEVYRYTEEIYETCSLFAIHKNITNANRDKILANYRENHDYTIQDALTEIYHKKIINLLLGDI
jgi:hypothetical protein